jgi:hypothetical protein
MLQNDLSSQSYEKFVVEESNQSSPINDKSLLLDVRKCAYFSQFGIDKSFQQAVKYLAAGFAEQCDLFLDMSLIKFIADHHFASKCFCLITQFLPYFTHESRLLDYCFFHTLSISGLNIHQRFLLFQVYKVKNLREFSSSSDLVLELSRIKTLVKREISLSRKFWSNPNVQLAFLW